MNSPDIHTLAGAYALDALPAEERRFFAAHLDVCDACRAEVAELHATAAKLGEAVAEPAPTSLRERVLAEIDTVRQDPPPPAPPRRASLRERARGIMLGAAAAALVGAVALAAVIGTMSARIEQLEARNAEVYEILAAEDAQTLSVHGSGGIRARFITSRTEERTMMIAEGLSKLDQDRTYELWLIDDSGAQPAGLFRPNDDGRAVHLLATALPEHTTVGITIEPAGGSLQPTTEPILVSIV